MNDWEKFEIKATDFLNRNFKNTQLEFKRTGKKNSLAPDIKIFNNNNHIFNIEAKLSPAQSGQFVVYKNNNKFIFSENNICDNNRYTKKIISYLNKNFSKFENGGDLPNKLNKTYQDRIINHYLSKNSEYIITSTALDSFYSIFPTKKLGEYFNITAKLRKKRSGTSHLPFKDFKPVKYYLQNHFEKIDKIMKDYFFNDDKKHAIVIIDKPINSRKNLYFGEKKYYLSEVSDSLKNSYYIKKRSNVNNLNVIFSLEYIGPEKNNGINKLKKSISFY